MPESQQQERILFSVSVQKEGYLLVVVSGRGGLGFFRAVVGFVGDLIASEREERVLVDLMASQPSLTVEEHRKLGEHAGKQWHGAQIAVVVPSVQRVLIGEQAAQAGGAKIRTFTNLHDAGEWLKVAG
jgi:hypothetical protein